MVQKKVHILTYGCQMNVSDSEKIAAALRSVGYAPADSIDDADMVILNTCSVRAKAEEKIYGILFTMKGELRKNPNLLIGVGGCVAQQEGERLLDKVPHLNFVFGTHSLHLLPRMVRAAEEGRRVAETSFIDDESRLDLFPSQGAAGGVTRFVTVMQGCDNFCSYCIVPYVRGREVSRRPSEILEEIRIAADAGTREVTLLGQNVNSYGTKGGDGSEFAVLLRQVAKISGIERIRFMTSHPKDISAPLIDCFADMDKLCSHIHLPVQAGSDQVLQMMNRGYTRRDYLHKVALLRSARPDILFTSDIIVGFPGENGEHFRETLALMEEVQFADTYTFLFSPRPETKAATLPDSTSREEKQSRLEQLLVLQRTMTRNLHKSLIGSVQQVLVEGTGRHAGQVYGRTSGNRIVNFPGPSEHIGTLQNVLIVKDSQNSMLGESVCRHD
jgi:tRNA-2-methylthio-N6-dimethylallyladenosine synthase